MLLPHPLRRSFVKFLGALTTDEGVEFAPVLVMGSFSEFSLKLVPTKIEQGYRRFSSEVPVNHVPFVFYIGDDDIPPHFQTDLPNGQMALVANIGDKHGDIFFTPFTMKYIHWLCRVRDRIIEQKGFSKGAHVEWNEYYEEFLSENPLYIIFAACQEEILADVQRIYNALDDQGLLDPEGYHDPYAELGISRDDF